MISCASSLRSMKSASSCSLIDCLRQGHADFRGNHLRQTVREPERLVLNACHVADHGPRSHGAERGNLADGIVPVEVGHMGQRFTPPFHADVDVEVRQGYPFRIQQAFEQKVVLERIEFGDAETEGHQRRVSGTPASHRHGIGTGPGHELFDDQEIARETHLGDDVEFVVQATLVATPVDFGRRLGQRLKVPVEALTGSG